MKDDYKLVIRKRYVNSDPYLNAPDEFWIRGKFIDNCEVDLSDVHWSNEIRDAEVFDHKFEHVFRSFRAHDPKNGAYIVEMFRSWHEDIAIKLKTGGPITFKKDEQQNQYIEYDLNPNKDTDLSKVSLRLDPEKGVRIKWHDCGESVSNFIKADQTGLAKLERMILALELSKKHILKLMKNGTEV